MMENEYEIDREVIENEPKTSRDTFKEVIE